MPAFRSLLTGAMLACALGVAAAGPASSAEPGEVVVVQPVLRQQFDPTAVVATTDFLAHDMLYDGLFNLTEKGITPALATSWEVSADGKQVDFTLREGVAFQNGDPFTAEDVKFTFDRVLAPDSTHSYRKPLQAAIASVEVLGPHKVRFVMKSPFPGFFTGARNALISIAPKAYYERVGAKEFLAKPVGTGPFTLLDLKAGEWTRYAAYEGYWGGAPKVKTVKKVLVKEAFTRYAMLVRGEADVLMDITGPLLMKIKQDGNVRIQSALYSGTSALYFNKTSFPKSQDKRVRLAIAHALNLQDIASDVLGDVCEPASSIFTPATFGHQPDLPKFAYDPELSKKLLAEAGIAPGTALTYVLHTESFGSLPNAPQVLEAMAGYLEAVGLKIERKAYETGAYLQMMRGGKQPDVFYGPISIPDDGSTSIDGWYLPGSVWSAGNVDVPAIVDLYERASVATDPDARRALLQEFARLAHDQVISVPLFWCGTPFAVGPRVKSWEIGLGSGYHLNLDQLVLAE